MVPGLPFGRGTEAGVRDQLPTIRQETRWLLYSDGVKQQQETIVCEKNQDHESLRRDFAILISTSGRRAVRGSLKLKLM